MEILSLLIGTVLFRPYVFAFLAIYLFLASQQLGWKRTLFWTLSGYSIAFMAEYSSINWGFPFGWYFYIDTTSNRELWVAGVPFMDSLSFSFLSFTGYSCAWQLMAAIKGNNKTPDRAHYLKLRRSPLVMIIGAAITTIMDFIIDPVTLMGDQWFLGHLYGYKHHGIVFGVPMSNFAGWFIVSGAIISVNQLLDRLVSEPPPCCQAPVVPYLHLGGFVLFFFVAAFNISVALWLKAVGPTLSGLFLAAAFLFPSLYTLKKGGLLTPSIS